MVVHPTDTHKPTRPYKPGRRRSWPAHHKTSIVSAILESPLSVKDACRAASITPQLYNRWLKEMQSGELYGTYDLIRHKLPPEYFIKPQETPHQQRVSLMRLFKFFVH